MQLSNEVYQASFFRLEKNDDMLIYVFIERKFGKSEIYQNVKLKKAKMKHFYNFHLPGKS